MTAITALFRQSSGHVVSSDLKVDSSQVLVIWCLTWCFGLQSPSHHWWPVHTVLSWQLFHLSVFPFSAVKVVFAAGGGGMCEVLWGCDKKYVDFAFKNSYLSAILLHRGWGVSRTGHEGVGCDCRRTCHIESHVVNIQAQKKNWHLTCQQIGSWCKHYFPRTGRCNSKEVFQKCII